MITSRMKKIIRILLEQDNYIRIADIASEISVSTRTILRELDDISKWISKNGASLEKKKGKGLFLKLGEKSKDEINELLKETKSETVYTPNDRGIILRAKLLQYDSPTKLYSLTRLLNVTESTVGSDLEHLESWFYNYNIRVIKKPGLGILLKGSEIAKRKAIVALIYEHFHTVDLIDVLSKNRSLQNQVSAIETKINSEILELLDIEDLSYVRDLLMAIEKEMGYQFADNGNIALALRFSITLRRKEFWGALTLDEKEENRLKKDRLYVYIQKLIQEDAENPFNRLPEIELIYLTMHIKGTKLRQTSDYNKISMIEDYKVITLVKEFIMRTEIETGIYLTDNEKLIVDLVKHLRPALYRLKLDLDIINPLVEEIRIMYPKLFKAIRQSVSVIEDKELVEVPDDEIAYLATHIGAVIHKTNKSMLQRYKAVVACMYGIGASSFLMAQIKKNFPNIEIVEVVSVFDDQIEGLNEDEVDVLISTVPLRNTSLPYVLINPILKDEDISKINKAVSAIEPSKKRRSRNKAKHLRQRLESFREYSDIITTILNNYNYSQVAGLKNMQDLILNVSRSVATDESEVAILKSSFEQREEKGSTILSKKEMLLLHCRADIAKEISLQILQLDEAIFVDQGKGKIPIETVVVMVAPVMLNQKILEILSEISRNIITENLLDIIKSKNTVLIEEELDNILDKFYQKVVLNNE